MNTHEDVRKDVSEHYARAVSGGGGCCSPREPRGSAAKLAGYRPEDVAALPDDAVANSFGCGNPLAFADVKEGDVVLDLGSGAGIDLLIAARRVGPSGRVIGVDMTDEMIAHARRNIAAAGAGNVEVRKGIIEELPVESATVDHVISNCVINLSPDKPRVFAEIARVLRPGGRMRVSDIVARDLPDVIKAIPAAYASCVSGAISEEDYVRGLQEAGLVDVTVEERLVYSADQLVALVASDAEQAQGGGTCGCGGIPNDIVAAGAHLVEGKVWSAKVSARKPE